MKKRKTKHEKELELAKASAPRYGIYINGGDIENLKNVIETISPLITGILNSESSENTKQMALSLIEESVPCIKDTNINNVNLKVE